jgi:hypothetical protein
VPKLPIGPLGPGPLAPTPLPGSPGLIPGQLQGEVCAPAANFAFKHPVYLCGGVDGGAYVSMGRRWPITSGGTIDALIAWVNSV